MENVQILDLQRIVTNWAWRVYDSNATRKEKKLRKKEKKATRSSGSSGSYVNVSVDWSDVHFLDRTTWSDIAIDEENENGGSGDKSDNPPSQSATPASGILFRTKYTNDTEGPQEYTIKTEKTTRSTCTTEIESCYTRGYEMSVTLKSPGEVFEANAGYHREYSLTNTSGETFEEELTWGVESLITVPKKTQANARLVVDEKKQQGNFVINSEISGTVFIEFTDIRDNNAFLKATGDDISEIVRKYQEKERKKGNALDFVKIEDNKVKVTTRGKCHFRYGVKQEIEVTEKSI